MTVWNCMKLLRMYFPPRWKLFKYLDTVIDLSVREKQHSELWIFSLFVRSSRWSQMLFYSLWVSVMMSSTCIGIEPVRRQTRRDKASKNVSQAISRSLAGSRRYRKIHEKCLIRKKLDAIWTVQMPDIAVDIRQTSDQDEHPLCNPVRMRSRSETNG